VDCGPLPDTQKQQRIHELDAMFAQLHGLEAKHLVHIIGRLDEG
jgi:hypothetical protein